MKELKAQIKSAIASKLKSFGSAEDTKINNAIDGHESRMHGGVKHRAAGGALEGGMAKPRMDRGGKKGKKKDAKTTVNVVIAQKDDKPAIPPPGMMPPPAGIAPPPKPPMMPPPGAGGPMPPPGAGPGGPPMPMRASGGRLTAGAGSAEGRLEKISLQKSKD